MTDEAPCTLAASMSGTCYCTGRPGCQADDDTSEEGWCDCEEYDCAGECCGLGNCTCTPTRPIETVELAGVSR